MSDNIKKGFNFNSWSKLPNNLKEDYFSNKISSKAFKIALKLLEMNNFNKSKDKSLKISYSTMVDKLGVHRNKISKALEELEEFGYLTTIKGTKGKANKYYLKIVNKD